jgi:hypothetical protein
MPVKKIDGKVVIIAGIGDIVWGPAKHQKGKEIDHILIGQGVAGEVGRRLPELDGKTIDDWAVKIVLPCKKSWASFNDIMQQYALEKWGEIPTLELPTTAKAQNQQS